MQESHTSTEIATERLRELILEGGIKPGEKLHQDQLAEQLGLSRTPLRTALTTLTQTGLVVYESNRGFRVREFSISDMKGAFEVRAELEATACRLAADNMTPEVGAELLQLVAHGDQLLSPGLLLPENLGPYRQMNVRFHDLIMRTAANPWIVDFVQRLHNVPMASDRIIMWRDHGVIARSHDDHHRIAQALSNAQGTRAAALMREHIIFALEHLLDHLEQHPEDILRRPTKDLGRPTTRNRRKNK
ncbi:GntR family transcriptional regulator [Paracoccus beibuensis]|uniref:GntR family transcriptional regulator n=1 Tax=Paracoccus beibuensis TaxID=547602 RepID=UPI0022409C21|nr:GntR family transcriptional regulator [Paracoccus beibuensis]